MKDLVSMSVQFQEDLVKRNRSHVNSTTFDESLLNKSKFTNISSNVSQEEELNRSRLPTVAFYSSDKWKTNSGFNPKYSLSQKRDKNATGGHRGVTLNQVFHNNVIINPKMIKKKRRHRGRNRFENKSVYWDPNYTKKILLDDGSREFASMARRSIEPESLNQDSFLPIPKKSIDDSQVECSTTEIRSRKEPSLAKISVSSDTILQWIKDTLEDATYFQTPDTFTGSDIKNNVMRQYKIDREFLSICGIPEEAISRLYRCLFVYSIGFNDLLKTLLSHCKDKASLISSIWRAFTVILEYSCKVEYKALINKKIEEHQNEITKIEKDHEEAIKDIKLEVLELRNKISGMDKYVRQCEKEKREAIEAKEFIQEQIKNKSEEYEYEVQLRLQFEAKLNSLHSAHRAVEGEFRTTKADRDRYLEELVRFKGLYQNFRKQYFTCNSEKETLESQLSFREQRIKSLIRENTLLQETLHEYEERVGIKNRRDKAQIEVDSKTGKRISVEEALKELHSISEVNQDLKNAEGISPNPKYLPKDQPQIYEERYNELNEKYLVIQSELNTYKAKETSDNGIVKEKDERISKLKAQIEEHQANHNKLDDKYQILLMDNKSCKETLKSREQELHEVTEKLKSINKARNKGKTELNVLEKKIRELQGLLDKSQEDQEMLTKRLENTTSELTKIHSEKEEVQNKLKDTERYHAHSIKQYEDKLSTAMEISAQNKKKKEAWAQNYEKEQSSHSLTMSNLTKLQTTLKETQLNLQTLKITTKSLESQTAAHISKTTTLNTSLIKSSLQNDKHLREIATLSKLLAHSKSALAKAQSNFAAQLASQSKSFLLKSSLSLMESEDLRSSLLRERRRVTELKAKLEDQSLALEHEREKSKQMKEKTEKEEREGEEERVLLEEMQMVVDEYRDCYEEVSGKWKKERKSRQILERSRQIDMDRVMRDGKKEVKNLESKVKKLEKIVRDQKLDFSKKHKSNLKPQAASVQASVPTRTISTATATTMKNIEDLKSTLESTQKDFQSLKIQTQVYKLKITDLESKEAKLQSLLPDSTLTPKYLPPSQPIITNPGPSPPRIPPGPTPIFSAFSSSTFQPPRHTHASIPTRTPVATVTRFGKTSGRGSTKKRNKDFKSLMRIV
ncbi:unnamed protein product [Moneuplotes crassus]|uniref:Uncharacterized protein n=1 Tax=Euplotes crassus TaxID=5936 RepID=A0AAD1U9N7_EUPCR|nr:unnamed protein product [Moneuplotes crassus]